MSEQKVYIGTLYVGENEIDECKTSVQKQTYKNITHEVFSYLPNKEAHDTLYSKFMELQNEYDYFIKLDADMVFIRTTIIEELVKIFEENKNLDHAMFSVHDWYSDSNIMGMHMFSNRVRWSVSKEVLFVDPDPKREGEKIIYWESPAPVAEHSPNPSIEEAFTFGYHRALKVIQRGKWYKKTKQSKLQLSLLHKSWKCLVMDHDIRRLAVIKGAEKAFNTNNVHLFTKHNHKFSDDIEQIEGENIQLCVSKLSDSWQNLRFRNFKYCIWPQIYKIPKKVKIKIFNLLRMNKKLKK